MAKKREEGFSWKNFFGKFRKTIIIAILVFFALYMVAFLMIPFIAQWQIWKMWTSEEREEMNRLWKEFEIEDTKLDRHCETDSDCKRTNYYCFGQPCINKNADASKAEESLRAYNEILGMRCSILGTSVCVCTDGTCSLEDLSSIKDCERLEHTKYQQSICYYQSAKESDDLALCDKIETEDDLKDRCIVEHARSGKDCEKVIDSLKPKCYYNLAKRLKEPWFCEKIKKELGNLREDCVFESATSPEVCEKMEEGALKDMCINYRV